MKKTLKTVLIISLTAMFCTIFFLIFCVMQREPVSSTNRETVSRQEKNGKASEEQTSQVQNTPSTDTKTEAEEKQKEDEEISFHPHSIKSTKPSKYIAMTQLNMNGKLQKNGSSWKRKNPISFEQGNGYTKVEGIVTFRGNNFRDEPVYGLADMKKNKLKQTWTYRTGSLTSHGKTWTGSGWTGQPLVVKWPRATKQVMNMHAWAKKDDTLVEAIYACLDGRIYFLDMKTGKETRKPLNIGNTFKGAGALDPRGYPILYVGAGFDSNSAKARVFVISLINGKILYTFGNNDSFSMRGSLSFFDSSSLVDAKTDTLIYPGENGVLYLIRLGTNYNEENGTLSVKPKNIMKWRYRGVRSSTSKYWLGMEDSAVVYKGYLYIQDNGGNFMCLNLNTMKLVWVQNCLDDSNGSPVMSIENGKVYLYASTSFHLGWRSSSVANIPIWKIDAETGKIIWKTEYPCQSMTDLSGGVQSTIALGKNRLSDNIYVTVSRTGGINQGVLACLSKKNGKKKWEHKSAYAWSSPVCVYNKKGKGAVLYANSAGKLYLLDGEKGKVYDDLTIGSCVESSPVVYDNRLIIGTRGCKIYGITLK